MITEKPTQKDRVLQVLRERGAVGLTALEALSECGTMRLAAYVKFLRDEGHDIQTEIIEVPGGKHVAKYTLADMGNPISEKIPVNPPTTRNGFLFDISQDAARN